jgi:hypothetical protein
MLVSMDFDLMLLRNGSRRLRTRYISILDLLFEYTTVMSTTPNDIRNTGQKFVL